MEAASPSLPVIPAALPCAEPPWVDSARLVSPLLLCSGRAYGANGAGPWARKLLLPRALFSVRVLQTRSKLRGYEIWPGRFRNPWGGGALSGHFLGSVLEGAFLRRCSWELRAETCRGHQLQPGLVSGRASKLASEAADVFGSLYSKRKANSSVESWHCFYCGQH